MELLEFREKIELPDNWEWTTIDQILDSIESGGRPKGGVKGILEGVPSIGGEHLQYSGGFDFSNIRYIPIEFFKKLSKGKIKYSDVLVVKDGATTGKTSFVSESFPFINAAVNEHVFILRPDNNKVKPKFLFFWMQSQFGQNCVAANFKGTAQGGITTGFTKNSPFPLVPINDQINIISKIEELFTQLDAAETALKRAKNNLKRYKQSLLQAAVTGELTRKWREAHKDELEPASKLLEKIKAERRAKWEADIRAKGKDPAKEMYQELKSPDISDLPELPEEWCWVSSEQLFLIVTSGSRGWAKYYSEDGANFLRIGNLDHGTISLDLRDVKKVKLPTSVEGLRTRVNPNDILISITADVGMIGLVPENVEETYINQHVSLARPVQSINAHYLAWFLASENAQKQFTSLQRGATKMGLGLDDIKSINVPLPSRKEQELIVSEIDEHLIIIENQFVTISKSLIRINSLKKVVLQNAFSGKLINNTEEKE